MNFKIKMFSFVFGFLFYQRNIWFRIIGNNNVCIFQGTKHKSGTLNLLENTVCLSSLNYNYYYHYYVKLTDLKRSSLMLTLLWKHNNKDFFYDPVKLLILSIKEKWIRFCLVYCFTGWNFRLVDCNFKKKYSKLASCN